MRIAIVNDMLMAVEAMRRVLLKAPGHELAWIARDGAEAVERCAKDTPDLVLMDLIMPQMDGVEATRRIMANTPCAIVVVTANVNHNSSKVFEAMGAGALDAVNTPTLDSASIPSGSTALLGKIDTINRLIGNDGKRTVESSKLRVDPDRPKGRGESGSTITSQPSTRSLVAIGASAGGPAALATLLAHLPANFPAAIVIVQHVDAQFAPGLASWLDFQTALPVRLAQAGDQPTPGTVLLAGSPRALTAGVGTQGNEDHLILVSPDRLGYSAHPRGISYRPSVDVFFRSVDRLWPGAVVGVLLTGMGRDGAAGLKALHDSGHHTIAQDRASSAVYGMPKAAAELQAATDILPLDKIGPQLERLIKPSVVRSP
ncbi:MAG: chemotaxis response regulator protein-glutamate methylesterase [Verrucomicrobia bacterium]|nr:chemotaxis response regulator protein-glutamate methylesterase [Verrucomicrobiota bacterium]